MSTQKPKTLLFTLEYPPQIGGVSKYYSNLVKYWGEDIFVLTNNGDIPKNNPNIIRKNLLNSFLIPAWLPSVWHLFRTIKKYKINHIIVGQILPLGTTTLLIFKFLKIDYSIILHGMDFAYAIKQKEKQELVKKILKKSKYIITGNKYTANLVKTFDESLSPKTNTINPAIETSFIRNPKKVNELKRKYNLSNKKILFSLGRLTKRKGFDKVITTIQQIEKKESDLVYAIGGMGDEYENLKKQAGKLLNTKIIFLGKISDEDYWAWLEICDIFIMTSRNMDGDFEGFGIVYLEANLLGKPVIAGDSGGVRDAVINNINGLLVNPENTEEIALAITKLANDKLLRAELGEAGKRRVVSNFNSKNQTEKIKKLINQ